MKAQKSKHYLTHEQFADLHGAGRLTEAMEELIPLAKTIASEVWESGRLKHTEVTFEEVQSWAYEGMCVGVNEWDQSRNVPLKTYTSQRIKWHLSDIFRSFNTQRAGGDAERISMDALHEEEASIEEQLAPAITAAGGASYETEDDIIRRIDLERVTESLALAADEEAVLDGLLDGKPMHKIGASIGRSKEGARQIALRLRKYFTDGDSVSGKPVQGLQSGPFIELCASNARRD